MIGWISYIVFFLILASIYAIMALGLNLQWGYTGLFNIGIVGFFAVGAYTFSILATPDQAGHLGGYNWPFLLALLGAMVMSGIVALIVGIPTLRLRDDYLAIATIGIAVSIQLIANNLSWLTGGPQGIYNIPQPLANYFSSNLGYNLFFSRHDGVHPGAGLCGTGKNGEFALGTGFDGHSGRRNCRRFGR